MLVSKGWPGISLPFIWRTGMNDQQEIAYVGLDASKDTRRVGGVKATLTVHFR